MGNSDKNEITQLVKTFYGSFTTTGELVSDLKSLFDANGHVIQFLPTETKTYTISQFIDSRITILSSGIYQEFKEFELSFNTMIDGKHAVRLSHYQKEGEKGGQSFRITGTKVFQLMKQNECWKLLSFSWIDNAGQKSIELRPVTEQDAPLLFELMTGNTWLTHIGDKGIKTVADARQYILDKMHPDLPVKGFVNHVIIDPETQVEVGTCSLHDREGVEGLDIGYAILEAHEGKGYATAAAQKMIDLAFDDHKVERVSAITTEDNKGSCRVLEKLGFIHDGHVQLPKSKERLKRYVLINKGA